MSGIKRGTRKAIEEKRKQENVRVVTRKGGLKNSKLQCCTLLKLEGEKMPKKGAG